MSWPIHGVVCMDCRTAYPDGASACDASPRHRLQRLQEPAQREALVTEVWGPPSVRRRARELARAGGAGAGGAATQSCSACDLGVASLGELWFVAVFIVVVVVVYWIGKKVYELVQRSRHRLAPHGALRRPRRLAASTGQTGVVVAGAALPAPITGHECVAYGLVLHSKRFLRQPVMLRDAATVGFDVRLDSGERVRVPAGRVVMDMKGARREPVPVGIGTPLDMHLRRVDPRRPAPGADLEYDDPLPGEIVEILLIEPGDRVEIRGALEPMPDPDAAAHGDFRQAAVVLTPRGVPQLARA